MTIPTPGISAPGYVFCARVADRKQPLFRYVGPGDEGTPIPDTLACLDRARPPQAFDTPRTLDDETYSHAFDAWDKARNDIVTKWNHLADKANLEPANTPRAHQSRRHSPLPRTLRTHPNPNRPGDRHPPRSLPPTHHPDVPNRHQDHPPPRRTSPTDTRHNRQPRARALHTTQTPTRNHPRRRPPRLLASAHPSTNHQLASPPRGVEHQPAFNNTVSDLQFSHTVKRKQGSRTNPEQIVRLLTEGWEPHRVREAVAFRNGRGERRVSWLAHRAELDVLHRNVLSGLVGVSVRRCGVGGWTVCPCW